MKCIFIEGIDFFTSSSLFKRACGLQSAAAHFSAESIKRSVLMLLFRNLLYDLKFCAFERYQPNNEATNVFSHLKD